MGSGVLLLERHLWDKIMFRLIADEVARGEQVVVQSAETASLVWAEAQRRLPSAHLRLIRVPTGYRIDVDPAERAGLAARPTSPDGEAPHSGGYAAAS